MEKYAKLMKGLEVCAGPECCKDGCPYYGETTVGMTCRARLLRDAEIAINNEQALHESAEEALAHRNEDVARLQADADNREAAYKTIRNERDKLRQECEELKEYALALEKEGQEARANGDKLREELATVNNKYRQMTVELSRLHADVDDLEAANNTIRAERDGMRIELERLTGDNKRLRTLCQGKTDRPSEGDKELLVEVGKMICEAKYQEGRADALAEIVARCSFGGGGRHD